MLGEGIRESGGHGDKTGGDKFVRNTRNSCGQWIVFELAEIGTAMDEEKFLLCTGDIS